MERRREAETLHVNTMQSLEEGSSSSGSQRSFPRNDYGNRGRKKNGHWEKRSVQHTWVDREQLIRQRCFACSDAGKDPYHNFMNCEFNSTAEPRAGILDH